MEVKKQVILEPSSNEYREVAWGVLNGPTDKITPLWINRGVVTDHQVKFEMLYSGICHTDCHIAGNELGSTTYPCVPGHELLGVVTEVGSKVTKFKVGDHVGVGCIVDACLNCEWCKQGDEQYCDNGMTMTYNNPKKHGRVPGDPNLTTFGGYSGSNVVDERFVLKIPSNLPVEKAAPILCAGITMWDPLRNWGATQGKKMTIGVVGIGGLGTMGIKIAKALGHDVVAISTSVGKESLAREKGATHFCVSTDPESIQKHSNTCDLILNVVSANHDLNVYLPLLKKSSTIVQLGLALQPHNICQAPLMFTRKSIAGSLIGGIQSTQECLDFCAKHQIWPDCQIIEADQINWAWEQLNTSNKDAVRFVVDIKKSLQNLQFLPK